MSRDKSIQTLRIYQFAGNALKMGKNFVIGDAVVGKIKKNQNRSGSVVKVIVTGHKCRIGVKWSDGTTTVETVRGIDKEGLVGKMRQYKKRKNCDLDEDAEEGSSEASSSPMESESALSSDEEPTIQAIEENRFVNGGAGPMKLLPSLL